MCDTFLVRDILTTTACSCTSWCIHNSYRSCTSAESGRVTW